MNEEELEKKIEEIDKDFESIIYDERTAIKDGIVDVDAYLLADLRIMWILKEVNSPDDEEWDMRDVLNNLKSISGTKIKEGWGSTFNSIVYATYGILNNLYWEDIPNTDVAPEIIDVLKKIAFVNVKKVSGCSKAIHNSLVDFHNQFGYILKKQIESFNPDVIICANTMEIIDEFGNQYEFLKENGMDFYTSEKHILVDAFHPNNSKLTQETYCDTIIKNVLAWKEKYKK